MIKCQRFDLRARVIIAVYKAEKIPDFLKREPQLSAPEDEIQSLEKVLAIKPVSTLAAGRGRRSRREVGRN